MEQRSLVQRLIARPEFGPLVLLVVELVVFWAINPDFLSVKNISNTLVFTVELGLIALPMTLLMTSGEFDLSVGSVFGFSAVLMWTLFNSGAMPMELAFLVALLTAALIGLVNGWFVTQLKIPSFLVTLGMLLVVRGTALFITDGFPQRTWNAEGIPLARLLVGDFQIGGFRIYMSLFWFIAVAGHAQLPADRDQGRQLDPGLGRQSGCGPRSRRERRPHQDRAVHAHLHPGWPRRHHQLDPHLGRQPQQRHRLRAGGDRHGRDRRHRPVRAAAARSSAPCWACSSCG